MTMTLRNPGPASLALLVGATVLLACSAYFAYRVGCAADLKGGHFGNPHEALRLGKISFVLLASGLAAGAFGLGLVRGTDHLTRIALATAFFVFGGIAFWSINFYLEGVGAKACSEA